MNNMTLKEAIKRLEQWAKTNRISRNYKNEDYIEKTQEEFCVAVDTVLRAIKIKDEYLKMINVTLTDFWDCMTKKDAMDLIDEIHKYAHMGLNNDDKSVISFNDKKKFNILHEEVQDE